MSSSLKHLDELRIPLKLIVAATNNFADKNLIIGRGLGFVDVYKGKLLWRPGGFVNIVVHRFTRTFVQSKLVFRKKMLKLSGLRHKSIVSILGYCDENKENIIIYEKDLSYPTLTSTQRLHICVGVAHAFSCIHNDTGGLTNIKISKKIQNNRVDAYLHFGVVLFEVLCGKKAVIRDDGNYLLSPIIQSYEEGQLYKNMDPDLRKQMSPQSLTIFTKTAFNCFKIQDDQPRPDLDDILKGLEKALELQLKYEQTLEHLKIQLRDIILATDNFAEECRIGSGGYGIVYKGELDHFDGKSSLTTQRKNKGKIPKRRGIVAIKRISNIEDEQGEQGFFIELEMLSSCEHPNVISLLGFSHEDPERILVYEYAFQGSLDDYLGSTNKTTKLTWVQRLRICLDIAHGLNYLHNNTEDKPRIIHRDVKSANILLGEQWNAKIADFGLSKFHPVNQKASTINTNNIAGTSVYLDPEYAETGKLKKESDVYSFGVVLFEILSGKLAYDAIYLEENVKGLASVARRCVNEGSVEEMVDPEMKEVDKLISTLNKGPNQHSLDAFSKIAYQCLSETQGDRPTMEVVIKELQNALNFQENCKHTFQISLEDIKSGTKNFSDDNCIIRGPSGKVYEGEVQCDNGHKTIVAKRLTSYIKEDQFLTELEILFKYKHENVIGLVGYCKEMDEKVIVYEHASNRSLDMHLNDVSLGWTKRLKICIDVASGLDFLHGGVIKQEVVIHGGIRSSSILLNSDWKAKISDFGHSIIAPKNEITGDAIAHSYYGVSYSETRFSTKEDDIYSLGVLLFEILCGRLAVEVANYKGKNLNDLDLDAIVLKGIMHQITPQSLTTFKMIAYQCLHHKRHKRPTAGEVVVQLLKALEFQEEYETWEPKLPRDYKEIMHMSSSPTLYSTKSKKDLYNMLSKGILLQNDKLWFSLGNHGERIELKSARTFSYKNRWLRKWRSVPESRFQNVAEMLDISDMKIQIKITQCLSPGINYRVHLVFKFCGPRKSLAKRMYVNLKYKRESENLNAYFATWREDGWMMIELCRFSCDDQEDIDFKVLLESFSRCYAASRAIYVEGIEIQAIDDVRHEDEKLKEVQPFSKSNSSMDIVQHIPNTCEEIHKRSENYGEAEKLFTLNKVGVKKQLTLLAKEFLSDRSDVKNFHSKVSTHSRFFEEIELLSQPVFHIKCEIVKRMLSPSTNYVCYLVFKLSENCRGLHCPVKVRDLQQRKSKEAKILYFRSPTPLNQHDDDCVPEEREDGLMEVNVWKFNSMHRKRSIPMNLKLIVYEGTMSGLTVFGLEVRPM